MPFFPVVLRIFDFECYGQASLTIAFFMFGHIFMKFKKLKTLQPENKKLSRHKI